MADEKQGYDPCICFADGETWEELQGHDWKLMDDGSYYCSNCGTTKWEQVVKNAKAFNEASMKSLDRFLEHEAHETDSEPLMGWQPYY